VAIPADSEVEFEFLFANLELEIAVDPRSNLIAQTLPTRMATFLKIFVVVMSE
jgi:hypothetical protein